MNGSPTLRRVKSALRSGLRTRVKPLLGRLRGDPDVPALVAAGMHTVDDAFWGQGLHLDTETAFLMAMDDGGPSINVNLMTRDDTMRRATGLSAVGTSSFGARSFIGAGATIMPGVKVGKEVIIAAGAVVCDDVPDGSVVGGNPAKVITQTAKLMERHRKGLEGAPTWTIQEWPDGPESTQAERDAILATIAAAPVAYRR